MERNTFIKLCGYACLGVGLLESCGGSRMVTGQLSGSALSVPLSAFRHKDGYKKYLIVQHEALQFPVCVFRQDDQRYTALLMRCTHQQAELQVFGDHLQCPAHGSEFNQQGQVQNGPATANLRAFPVSVTAEHLDIDLR